MIELTEHELFTVRRGARGAPGRAARARRARRARRRGRRLRRAPAADPRRAGHPQDRPLAGPRRAQRRVALRAARGARHVRRHHRRRGLRRGRRGSRRPARARRPRRHVRPGLRARAAGGPWAALSPQIAATAARARRRPRRRTGAIGSVATWARTLAELGDDLAEVTDTRQLVTAGRRAAAPARRRGRVADVGRRRLARAALRQQGHSGRAVGAGGLPGHPPADGRAHARARSSSATPRAIPTEIAELVRLGYGAVLMVPVRVGRRPARAGRGLPRAPAGVHQRRGRSCARRRAAVRAGAG